MRWIVARGVAGSALLTAGGLCYARVPRPSHLDDIPGLADLRASDLGIPLGLLLSAVGLVLLTWAWWGLRTPARCAESGVRSVRIAVASWCAPLVLAPPLFSGDGWSYVATGYLTGQGHSPYTVTPRVLPEMWKSGVNGRWLDTVSPYGPLPHVWGGALSHLADGPWSLLVSYRVLALLGVALVAWATPLLASRCGRDPGSASWLVLASPFLVVNGVGGLHNDVLVVGLGLAALALARRDRWVWASVLVGAAASVKVPGGLVAVGVVLLSVQAGAGYGERIRQALRVGSVATATVLLIGVVSGLGTGWIGGLSVAAGQTGRLSLTSDVGWLLDILFGWRSPGLDLTSATQTVGMGATVLVAAAVALRQRTGEDSEVLRVVAVLMLAVTVLCPVAHYWYFLGCMPLLACVALSRRSSAVLNGAVTALGWRRSRTAR